MIPQVPATPAMLMAIPQQNLGTVSGNYRVNQAAVRSLIPQTPLTSPSINSTPAVRIAQSELPGGSTPGQMPPPPASIRDNGNGYPTRTPLNYVGPAVSFGNGNTAFGVVSRFEFRDKYSIRPSATFGTRTTVRVPLTYDFNFGEPEPFEPNPLTSFHAGGGVQFSSGGGSVSGDKFSLLATVGVDLNLFPGVVILADFNTDLGSNSGATVGLGFEF